MKKIIYVLIILFTLVGVCGCNNSPTSSTSITITDQANRVVTLQKPATRIVSAYYSSTTLCLALGLKDNLVAIEQKANTRKLYQEACSELLDLPGVSTKKDINVELTLNQNPDLVILPLSLKNSAESFTQVGVAVIVVNPESSELIAEAITIIGKATNKEKEALAFNNYNASKIVEIEDIMANIENRPTVYLSSSSSYFSTCPSGYYQTELIYLAGGISVSKDVEGSGWQIVNAEQLLSWKPQYFLYVCDAAYTKEDILNDQTINSLDAVKNNLYRFPSLLENWDANNASSTLGVLWLASLLHEDLYSKSKFMDECRYFYKTFFNLDVTEEMLGI